MEAALVSAATGVLKPVLGKLAALLGDEYKRFKGVHKEIKSLTHELAAMEAFLLKMSEVENPNVQDKVWMNEVRELSYDMEDAIDDFMQSIYDKDEKPDGFIGKIKSSLGKLGKMKARHRIGKEIQNLKKQITEVGERNSRYMTGVAISNTRNATVDLRALSMLENASKLVGIDEPKAEIIKLLTEGESTNEQPKLVSIVGAGGMGKTTLANQVYQDLKEKFECQAFLSVSRNPDMINILRIILSEVSGQDYATTEAGNIQQLIIKITNFLANKSIFPEDSFIEMQSLIMRWIGEEFIHKEGRYTAQEIGERCFNELLNRGLIQPGETNEYGEVKSCRVHDIILDFIVSKSIEENFVTILSVTTMAVRTQSKVVRRFSLQGIEEQNSTISKAGLVLSHVRSLNVFEGFVEIPSLGEFRHLRVFHFDSYMPLEDHHLENIVRLMQLRYLNLQGTKISELPEQIGSLGCLEILNLRFNHVRELPASIVKLEKLSHLLVDDYVKFPDGVAKMQALETLEDVRASIQPFDFLCGLGQLKNLRRLQLDLIVVWEDCNKAIASSLCKLGTQNLRSLTIYKGSSLLHEPLYLPMLEKLMTWFSVVPEVPKWVSSLRNLQLLRLEVDVVKQDDICILGALPTLLILHLIDVTNSNEKLRISGVDGFKFLRIFMYVTNSHKLDLMFAAGSMPKLEKLDLSCLHILEANYLDFGIENLLCLITVKFVAYGRLEGVIGAIKTALERAANTHSNHPSVLFERIQ
ncbi:disease resistance protein Pik-2-like isoform X2 [Triticum dicoccoides]|uniref:disease resistance protein Pik-2-like isoform X2 n=1 Tax=Triticum dicoccoides TaxID=85692 RepID=UPI0018918BC4|nr:disease resistance protein Pik-2-like isoform X2 [Triticum dicoccoides]